MKSIEFLEAAIAIQAERGAEYNKAQGERSAQAVATAFNAITGKDLTESEVWLLLQVLKDVRQWADPTRYHHDSAVDSVAYCSLKAEALHKAGVPQPIPDAISDPVPEHWRKNDAVIYVGTHCETWRAGCRYQVLKASQVGKIRLSHEGADPVWVTAAFCSKNFAWVERPTAQQEPAVCTEPARPPLPEHWRPGDAVRFTGGTRMHFENGELCRVVEPTNLGCVSVIGRSGFVGCWPFGAATTEWRWEDRP